MQEIVNICKKEGVIIVSDKIHSDLTFKKHTPLPLIDGAKDITIHLHSPSKSFNVAGLNDSYTIILNDSLKRAYKLKLASCGLEDGNIFSIEVLITAYSKCGYWVDEVKEYLLENKRFVVQFLAENIPQIKAVDSEATFLLWLDCKGLNLTQKELQELFVNRVKLALNSGTDFGENGTGFMRLNIATSKEILEEAINRLLMEVRG